MARRILLSSLHFSSGKWGHFQYRSRCTLLSYVIPSHPTNETIKEGCNLEEIHASSSSYRLTFESYPLIIAFKSPPFHLYPSSFTHELHTRNLIIPHHRPSPLFPFPISYSPSLQLLAHMYFLLYSPSCTPALPVRTSIQIIAPPLSSINPSSHPLSLSPTFITPLNSPTAVHHSEHIFTPPTLQNYLKHIPSYPHSPFPPFQSIYTLSAPPMSILTKRSFQDNSSHYLISFHQE